MDINAITKIDSIFAFLAFMGVLTLSYAELRRQRGGNSNGRGGDDRVQYLIAEHEWHYMNITRIDQRLSAIEQRLDEIWQFLAKTR